MRICLVFCDSEKSLFLSERGQWTFIIADYLKILGHTVTIRPVGEVAWLLSASAQNLLIGFEDNKDNIFDVVIDIGGSVHSSLRRTASKTVVVFLYNNTLFDELQDSSYVAKNVKRTITKGAVDQVWIWEGQEAHTPLLSSLYQCPVCCVSFIWSPFVIKELFSSIEIDTTSVIQNGYYSILQLDKDNTMTSVWPLSFLNERQNVVGDVSNCVVFDMDGVLSKSKFYKDNIESNLSYRDKIVYKQFESLESLYQMCLKSVTIFHTRYKPYQIHIFNFMWMGLPLIHNSPVLRNGMCSWNYFGDNSFSEAERALEVAQRAFSSKHVALRQREIMTSMLEESWSFKRGSHGWNRVMESLPLSSPKKCDIIISFSDMWEGFDATDNFFVDLLKNRESASVCGVEGISKDSSIHICGPFGKMWQLVPKDIPVVFFSGERWEREDFYEKSRISLFLTHDVNEDERHIRLPLWILFLELWGGVPKLQRNPNGLPLPLAMKGETIDNWNTRNRFCGFVVSNPTNMERNIAFELLHSFKEVDSGGAFKNNIGGPISHMYGGGGGGDIAKHAFLKERRFCLCYENSSAPGYVTEKLLHAKMAGCIPIYWGCREASSDFDAHGFIDMTGVPVNEIVSCVEKLYNDNDACERMIQTPALNTEGQYLDKMWKCVHKVGDALLQLIKKQVKESGNINTITMTDIHTNNNNSNDIKNAVFENDKTPAPLFVSFITKRFIPSIQYALEGVKGLGDPRIEYLLYIGSDVCDEDISGIKSKYDTMLIIRKIPFETNPAGEVFPDFWTPSYFGWKLWIYNQITNEFKDRLLVYSDAGAQWTSLYPEMFEKAWKTGICFVLDDIQNKNRFWCSEEMISEMNVTEEELEAPQILGGIMAIRGGHEKAMAFFETCLKYGLNPRILKGRKLIRVLPGGQPVGHRHDQSIMSVERVRTGMSFGYVSENKATCMESLRRTLQNKIPIYLHRGNYCIHSSVLNKVDDIWIVNLERRLDRLISFNNQYPALGEVIHRFSAIDGKILQLTPAIAKLFYHNDFNWKKSVVGCALSHILLWAQLACEGPGVNSYLILEDDVRFIDHELIDKVLEDLPTDCEVGYLGGILPRNRQVYEQAIQPVNNTWAEIKSNVFFSKMPMPVFHHCTYAYYLSKNGARKLLRNLVDSGVGCFTSIDHYLGHPIVDMKKYVLKTPIASCFQDSDPKYTNAEFDDFNRVDSYDSDIWNNVDMYKVCLPNDFKRLATTIDIKSLYPMICDVLRQIPSSQETCTLLSPGPYLHMLQMENRTSEIETIKDFLQQLQVEMKMPALITFDRRIDSIVCKKNEVSESNCKSISIVESSGENYTKSCLMSKMFLVNRNEGVNNIIKHTALVGSIPIYIRSDGDDVFWNELRSKIGIVELRNWAAANKFISILLENTEKGEKYRWGIVEKCLQMLNP